MMRSAVSYLYNMQKIDLSHLVSKAVGEWQPSS